MCACSCSASTASRTRYRRPPTLARQATGPRRAVPPLAERTVRTYATAASRFVSFLAREGHAPLNLEVLREKLRATRRRYSPTIPFVGTETIERIVAQVKAQPARQDAPDEVKRRATSPWSSCWPAPACG